MSRSLNKLSDVAVKAARKPGRHSDGGGLYLYVSPGAAKSWVFVWSRAGKKREMGLGRYPDTSLAKARTKATDCREMIAGGLDPIAERNKEEEPTFAQCRDKFLSSMDSAWLNDKHRAQWRMTLTAYCAKIADKKVSTISTAHVLDILNPIWLSKAETASRLRGRIERVLDFAKAKGWREGENPALWRGHLKNVLPARQKLQRGHHSAMPYPAVPAFVASLQTRPAMAARALEFLILNASRSGEVYGCRWTEIDLDELVWVVPAARMKSKVEHRVPLSKRAAEILRELQEHHPADNPYVFHGERKGKPLSGSAMEMLLRRMEVDATVHGFRSSFRDWVGDATTFQREVAEAALAHKVGDETERAYRRSDALAKRRRLMAAWAEFLAAKPKGKVVDFNEARKRA